MLSNQSNMLEILTTIVITITSFMVIIKTVQLSTKKELFLNVYFPLFKALSPFLYKKLSIEELENLLIEIDNIIADLEYLPFHIRELIDSLHDGLSKGEVWQKPYTRLCRHIDMHCNTLCVLLGFPKRTLLYRFRYNQFSNYYVKWTVAVIFTVFITIVCAFIAIFVLTILAWLKILLVNILSLPI